MTTPQSTPRAAQAILGADAARRQLQRTEIIARQLHQIAPGTAKVRSVPVTVEGRRRTWVVLDDALGLPLTADRDAHRDAHGLLTRMFPGADWTMPQTYDVSTGQLAVDEPPAPEALALDWSEVGR